MCGHAEPVDRRADRVFAIHELEAVAADEFAAGLVGGALSARFVDIGDQHPGAFLREAQGGVASDPVAPPVMRATLFSRRIGSLVLVSWRVLSPAL